MSLIPGDLYRCELACALASKFSLRALETGDFSRDSNIGYMDIDEPFIIISSISQRTHRDNTFMCYVLLPGKLGWTWVSIGEDERLVSV